MTKRITNGPNFSPQPKGQKKGGGKKGNLPQGVRKHKGKRKV